MKIIHSNETFKIYTDTLVIYDKLPAGQYLVCFNKMTGFYLTNYPDIEIKEKKIYGKLEQKADKCLNSFSITDKNLGVILSGEKGIGKSLCAKLISKKAIEKNIPVIIIDKFVPEISNFIEEIDQEVVVLFDEFDKTFSEDMNTSDNQASPQTSLLSLFDGISQARNFS